MSFIVNPLSAMIAMPGLSSITSRKPVNSTSEMEPTKTEDIKHIAPLGVQATKILSVMVLVTGPR